MPGVEHSSNKRHPFRRRSQETYRSCSPIAQIFQSQQPQQEQQRLQLLEEKGNIEKCPSNPQILNVISEHQVACPFYKLNKIRCRDDAKSPSREVHLHPRAWGVRSPKDIRCTCKIPKNTTKSTSGSVLFNAQVQRPKTSSSNKRPLTAEHLTIEKIIDTACKQVSKVNIELKKDEIFEYLKSFKAALDKKISSSNNTSEKWKNRKTLPTVAQQKVTENNLNNSTPTTTLQSPTTKNVRGSPKHSTIPATDNILLTTKNHDITMTPTAVVGTLESTNYIIELNTQPGISKQNAGEINKLMSHVMPIPVAMSENKPKFVSVDGAYYAEVPSDFGVCRSAITPVRGDGSVLTQRTENLTFYAVADKTTRHNVTYARPKTPYNAKKLIPVVQSPTLQMQSAQSPTSNHLVKK